MNTTFNYGKYSPNLIIRSIHVFDETGTEFNMKKEDFKKLDERFQCTITKEDIDELSHLVHCHSKTKVVDENDKEVDISYFMCSPTTLNTLSDYFELFVGRRSKTKNIISDPAIVPRDLAEAQVFIRDIIIQWSGQLPVKVSILRNVNDFNFTFEMTERVTTVSLPDSELYISAFYRIIFETSSFAVRLTVHTSPIYDCVIRRSGKEYVMDFAECQFNAWKKEIFWIFLIVVLSLIVYFILKRGYMYSLIYFLFWLITQCIQIRILSIIMKNIKYYLSIEKSKKEDDKNDIEMNNNLIKDSEKHYKREILIKSAQFPKLNETFSNEEIKEIKKAISADENFLPHLYSGYRIEVDTLSSETLRILKENSISKENYIKEVGLSKYKPMNIVMKKKKFEKLKENKPPIHKDNVVITNRGIFRILLLLNMILFGSCSICDRGMGFTVKNNICFDNNHTCYREAVIEHNYNIVGSTVCASGSDEKANFDYSLSATLLKNDVIATPTFSYITSEIGLSAKSATHCKYTIFQSENVCYDKCTPVRNCGPQLILHQTNSLKQPCYVDCRTGVQITDQVCFFENGCLAQSQENFPTGAHFTVFGGFTYTDNPVFSVKSFRSGQQELTQTVTGQSGKTTKINYGEMQVQTVNDNRILDGKCVLIANTDMISKNGKNFKKGSIFVTECTTPGNTKCETVGSFQITKQGNFVYDISCNGKTYSPDNKIEFRVSQPLSKFIENAIDYSSIDYFGSEISFSDGSFLLKRDINLYIPVIFYMKYSYPSLIFNDFSAHFYYKKNSMRGLVGKPDSSQTFTIVSKEVNGEGSCSLMADGIHLNTINIIVKNGGEDHLISFVTDKNNVNFVLKISCNGKIDRLDISGILSDYKVVNYQGKTIVATEEPSSSGIKFKFFSFSGVEEIVLNVLLLVGICSFSLILLVIIYKIVSHFKK